MKPLRLAVRKLVEQVMRAGDIDSRYTDANVMLEGANAHRRIQKSYGSGEYQKEVSLSLSSELDGIAVTVYGRADGIISQADGSVIIDEIKTSTLPLERIITQSEQHLGQVKCYAHMLLESRYSELESVLVQLTYYQLDSGEIQKVKYEFTKAELSEFYQDLLSKYADFMYYEHGWRCVRNDSVKIMTFPYERYRSGQRELAVAVYRTVERGRRLYAQAPTGIGKTVSVLFPAIKAMPEGKTDKLFYLTAKTVTRTVAEDAVSVMCDQGLRFKSVTLRAKEKICFKEECFCNPDYCEYAKGHYERVNTAILDILGSCDLITAEVIRAYSAKHRVCPHETSLDVSVWADLVIGDYNHVFDPRVYLRRFFENTVQNAGFVFLFDEAHNLPDRVRDMYSVRLKKSDFLRLYSSLKDKNEAAKKLRGSAGEINRYLLVIRKELNEYKQSQRSAVEQDSGLEELITRFIICCAEWLTQERQNAHEQFSAILELYFSALNFTLIADLYDECFCRIEECYNSELIVTYFCLDPSHQIGAGLECAGASIFFSATLSPLSYYRELMGGEQNGDTLTLLSPFDKNRLLLIAHKGISTRYAEREGSIEQLVEAIYTAVSVKGGNYMVFFPSYEYMRTVYSVFCEKYHDITTIIQQSAMDEEERTRFLQSFEAAGEGTLVGFCVLGGIFSEGIDLKGDRLIGTVIVGVGLPKISFRQNLIRQYYDNKKGCGYDYAYVYPGMNKVLQAAGRVIRSESDFGIILLIDSRFDSPRYKSLYPAHWSSLKIISSNNAIHRLVKGFKFFSRICSDI